MDLLGAIETLPPVAALKASFIVYPLLSALHIMAIGAVFTSVALMDVEIIRARHDLTARSWQRLRPVAMNAFAVAALTGLALFAVNARDYAGNPAFRLKLLLIAAAALNLLLFDRSASDTRRLLAGVSLALWTGVLLCGRFIGYL